jgi:hypothetical protein
MDWLGGSVDSEVVKVIALVGFEFGSCSEVHVLLISSNRVNQDFVLEETV